MMDKQRIDELREKIDAILEAAAGWCGGAYYDLELGVLDGTFTPDALRAIADAMEEVSKSEK